MKNYLILTATLMLGLAASARGQTYQNNYHKIFDVQTRAEARAMIRTNDMGYMCAGWYADPSQGGERRPLLIKLNVNFQPMWARTWATAITSIPIGFEANDVFQTGDTGYIVCGRYVEAESRQGAFLMKLDAAGLLQWFRVYPAIDNLNSVIEMPWSGPGGVLYMACGSMRPFSAQRQRSAAAILTADISGNPFWIAYVSGPKDDMWATTNYRQIIRYGADTAALVGSGNVDYDDGNLANQYDSDVLVSIVNTSGAFLMNELYGKATEVDPTTHETYAVMETGASLDRDPQTGDLLITGSTYTNCISACGYGSYADLLLFRVSVASGGTVVWAERCDILGPLETSHDRWEGGARLVYQPAAQRLFVTGTSTNGFLSGGSVVKNDILLLEATSAGVLTSWELFGGLDHDSGAALVLPNMNSNTTSAAMLGTSESYNTYGEWYFVERFTSKNADCHDLSVPFQTIPIDLPLEDPLVQYTEDTPFSVVLFDQEPETHERVICEKTLVIRWGDLNCDDFVDFFDIDAFLLALLDLETYTATYPNCDARQGDVNGDGMLDFFDIDPFINCILNGECP